MIQTSSSVLIILAARIRRQFTLLKKVDACVLGFGLKGCLRVSGQCAMPHFVAALRHGHSHAVSKSVVFVIIFW